MLEKRTKMMGATKSKLESLESSRRSCEGSRRANLLSRLMMCENAESRKTLQLPWERWCYYVSLESRVIQVDPRKTNKITGTTSVIDEVYLCNMFILMLLNVGSPTSLDTTIESGNNNNNTVWPRQKEIALISHSRGPTSKRTRVQQH